ncbi:FluG domain-containing protein [Histoplasma capsulatum H143]|uniref:FluG domain-containing protein n=1 Tax=Ajellomyces capsulatus (strain H143) TaxID=544712 RepID=C6HDW0_AJECH|nr:FluG domain-containing protein [Histoplasma capsulatum H143]
MFSQWTCLRKVSKPIKESRRARKKTVEELTPDEYRARDTVRLARFQITGKKYADAPIIAINRVQRFWDRHCSFMGVDAHSHLSACVDENFRVYADWRLKNFNITKQNQPDQHVLVMEVSLMFMKGKRNKSQPRQPRALSCLPLLALALADDAFDARGISSVEDVLRIQVMTPRNSLHLKWKPHMLNVPVFRRAVHTAEGIRISPDKALPYNTFNQYLQRLGRNAGFEHKLTPYCIRQGTANTVDKSIIQAVGRFSLTRDPHAPKELSNKQKEAIEQDPQLVKLCDRQHSLHKLIERKHSSISKSKGTVLHREYTELGDTIRAEKQTLHREAFEDMRQEFFATIDTVEIERQLLGLPISEKLKMDDEDKVQFAFEERARLARNLSSDCRTKDQHELYVRRVQTSQDWVSLCSLHEGPRKRRVSSADSRVDITFDGIVDADTFPISCPGTQCLFCLGDSQLPHSARIYSFSRPDHLQRHVQNCHLRYLDPDVLLWCPHPSCPDALDGVEDFQGHALIVHNAFQAEREIAQGRWTQISTSDRPEIHVSTETFHDPESRPTWLKSIHCNAECQPCMRRPSAPSRRQGRNMDQQEEIAEIYSQALKMIEILKRMSAILETIETASTERHETDLQDQDAARSNSAPVSIISISSGLYC